MYDQLPRPCLFGHRGARGAPENSLAALALAKEADADGVEIDVRPCRDGSLVLAHDPSLARLTRGRDERQVAELSEAELSALAVDGEPIATLASALAYCAQAGLALNVELKRDVPSRWRAVRALAAALARREQPLLVSSFDPLMLAGFASLCPHVPVALLLEPGHRFLHGLARLGAAALHPERRLVSPASVQLWHRQRLRVVVWTVNDPAEARRLLSAGADGLISDVPASLRDLVTAFR